MTRAGVQGAAREAAALSRAARAVQKRRVELAPRVTDGRVDRIRPLCPYPQIERYKGTGSIDRAERFACTMP